ncbi:type II secretion system protein [Actinomadura craniellae]|uniref:Type II secretion system protein n=1 Tax=Actinomadura craniellae TaxID=2231787 RepID=A0A365H996_9ACTN|nr:type II secretion system F family protein [Actinomadura craniellae]RAY14843.1 type II secretion system protein [Actinomadura craniellae]
MTAPALPAAALVCAVAAIWIGAGPAPATIRLRELLVRPVPGPVVRVARRAGRRVATIRAERGRHELWRSAVIELCDGVAAELAAGRAAESALAEAAAALDERVGAVLLTEWARGRAAGEDTAAMLDRLAARPGADGLRLLAACWRIGAERGGTFGTVIEGLAGSLREEEAQRREVASQLAGPRATARLLAALPLLGLAMAGALGARPLAFLFGTIPGAICLVLGLGLDALGLHWTRRLVTAAQTTR